MTASDATLRKPRPGRPCCRRRGPPACQAPAQSGEPGALRALRQPSRGGGPSAGAAVAEAHPQLLAAAWLHDVLEDTCSTPEEYEKTKGEIDTPLGSAVLELELELVLVLELTDDKSLPRGRAQAPADRDHGRQEPGPTPAQARGQGRNIGAVAVSPPAAWDAERIAAYVRWGEEVVASCRGLNMELEKAFGMAARIAAGMAAAAAHAKVLAIDPQYQ